MADAVERIEVRVESVLMSSQGPVVMLAPSNGHTAPPPEGAALVKTTTDDEERVIPIFIDHGQALNIQMALEGQLSPRPMTHDLFSTVLNELGAIVEKVVIDELQQNTFYASLYVQIEKGNAATSRRFDARPSDCIALAVRVGAPLFVSQKLMDEASIARDDVAGPEDEEGEEPGDGDDEPAGDVDLGVSR